MWSNTNFQHSSHWITFPTQSCLVLYSFCISLLHPLIMSLMVSSLSPHNLHLLLFCVLSILALLWLVLLALFCAATKRNSVSLLRFPFPSHLHIFSCVMLLVSQLKCQQSYFLFPFLFSGHFRSANSHSFWLLWSVFLCAFLSILRVVVPMHQYCLQCWYIFFLLLFWTHIVGLFGGDFLCDVGRL